MSEPNLESVGRELDRLRAELVSAEAERDRLQKTVSFFASVIKGGERWTPTCEKALNEALTQKGSE